MFTLFGYRGSGSAAVECALEVAGLDYELVSAASWAEDSAVERLAQVNPLRQIPTLVLEDGTAISESAAILIHLGLQYPHSDLLPAEPAQRALALRGLVYIPANCYSLISVLDFPERYLADPSEAAQQNLHAGTRALLHRHWQLFAGLYRPDPYLCGAGLSALDLMAAVVSRWSGSRQHLQRARPAFAVYLARVDAHPAVAPVFARHFDGD